MHKKVFNFYFFLGNFYLIDSANAVYVEQSKDMGILYVFFPSFLFRCISYRCETLCNQKFFYQSNKKQNALKEGMG